MAKNANKNFVVGDKKLRIAVLAGGLSPERDVSLASGALIARALIDGGYDVALADVYMGIKDFNGDFGSLFTKEKPGLYIIESHEPDLEALIASNGGRRAPVGENIIGLCCAADVVFLALHGGMGENGQLQATLDSFDICYTGSGYAACFMAMDKAVTRRVLCADGVPMAEGFSARASELKSDEIIARVGLPCVVKPNSCGSSVGVSIVNTRDELESAITAAAAFDDIAVIEKKITGCEFSVGILEGRALPAIEIIPVSGFYDYKNKYQGGCTREICPAELTEGEASEAAAVALGAYRALRLEGYARVDVMQDSTNGHFYCLEANALPGMTPTSLLPQEAAAVGIDYIGLCRRIVDAAIAKKRKNKM